MSKAILVLKKMPKKCADCPLCQINNDDFESTDMVCDIIGYQDDFEKKPKNCPLKEMPKKIEDWNEWEYTDLEIGEFIGYNKCLKDILGEDK